MARMRVVAEAVPRKRNRLCVLVPYSIPNDDVADATDAAAYASAVAADDATPNACAHDVRRRAGERRMSVA